LDEFELAEVKSYQPNFRGGRSTRSNSCRTHQYRMNLHYLEIPFGHHSGGLSTLMHDDDTMGLDPDSQQRASYGVRTTAACFVWFQIIFYRIWIITNLQPNTPSFFKDVRISTRESRVTWHKYTAPPVHQWGFSVRRRSCA